MSRFVWLVLLSSTVALAAPQRFALIIANGLGDPADVPLRYADDDATHVAEVLEDVGGIAANHLIVLRSATAGTVRSAMARIRSDVAGDEDAEWLIYVSAHADEANLHLGGTYLPFNELADFAKTLPVRLVVTVVDACRAGVATRLKGAKVIGAASVFAEVPVEGRVVIASSSSDESSQESDLLKGSVFTHHLLAGLRGAADQSGDGQVTVSEAYAYAKSQTVVSTLATQSGPQHPEFHVDLRGSSDLVLTDVSQARASIELLEVAPGSVGLVNLDGHAPVAELRKTKGPMRIALSPGRYQLWLRTAAGASQASFVLPSQGQLTLRSRDLTAVAPEVARAKDGDAPSTGRVRLAISPMISTGMTNSVAPMFGGKVRGHVRVKPDNQWFFSGALLALFGTGTGFTENDFSGRVGIGYAVSNGSVSLFGTLELGGLLIRQYGAAVTPSRISLVPMLTPTLGLDIPLTGRFSLTVEASASLSWLVTVTGSRAAIGGEGSVGFVVSL